MGMGLFLKPDIGDYQRSRPPPPLLPRPRPPPPPPPRLKPPPPPPAPRPPPKPPARGSRGRASFTFKARPFSSRPFIAAIALPASSALDIPTKAKPRGCPVSRSLTTLTLSTAPNSENAL